MKDLRLPFDYTLLVLGGLLPNEALFLHLADGAKSIVATDAAAEQAFWLNLNVDAIIGDLDGLTDIVREHYRSRGAEIVGIPDQDSNDFEKALLYLKTKGVQHLRIIGIEGKRIDHTLTNFSVLARHADDFADLAAYDLWSEIVFLTDAKKQMEIHSPGGTTVSLLPLPEASGVRTEGLKYALDGEPLVFAEREGLSNVMLKSSAKIEIGGGRLLVSVAYPSLSAEVPK